MNWTTEFPKNPGYYWFYGYPYGKDMSEEIEFRLVKVIQAQRSLVYVSENEILYRSETHGAWIPASLPELPSASIFDK